MTGAQIQRNDCESVLSTANPDAMSNCLHYPFAVPRRVIEHIAAKAMSPMAA